MFDLAGTTDDDANLWDPNDGDAIIGSIDDGDGGGEQDDGDGGHFTHSVYEIFLGLVWPVDLLAPSRQLCSFRLKICDNNWR